MARLYDSAHDPNYLDLGDYFTREIIQAFGVPAPLVGVVGSSTIGVGEDFDQFLMKMMQPMYVTPDELGDLSNHTYNGGCE